jgi:hypothetical protein
VTLPFAFAAHISPYYYRHHTSMTPHQRCFMQR